MAFYITPKVKRSLLRILPFGIIWLVLGWVFLFIEHAAVKPIGGTSSIAIQLNFRIIIFASVVVFAVGLFIGLIEILFMDKLFKKESLTKKIVYKLMIYGLFFFLINLVFFPIAASLEMNVGLFDNRVWDRYFQYLTSITHVSVNIQMATSLGLSLFYGEISDNIGQSALLNFFTGKYHRPIQEERIFMFLDMRSSTTIAEKLGHIQFFNLLQDYYADLADPIIQFGGELYQYVGDEIIISWKPKTGLNNNNCIRSFFAMKEELEKKKERYLKKFGLFPTFKAGAHIGRITTGEIGVLRKEIFFTGDILNATARIQGLCNTFKVDFLISEDLRQQLQPEAKHHFTSMGKTELRGKKKQIELYSII